MRSLITILLFFAGSIAYAQADSIALKLAIAKLDKALLGKDSTALSQLLSDDLSFGHSNGWVQTKTDVWNDFASGKLEYKKINTKRSVVSSIGKTWAVVRANADVEGRAGEMQFNITIHVLQFWMKSKNGWQLLARQSAKIN
jgi:hypothetical protein